MRLSYRQKRNVLKILPFGLIGGGFGVVYALLEVSLLGDLGYYPATGNPYYPLRHSVNSVIQAFVMGLFFGTLEIVYLHRIFEQKRFAVMILLKTAFYLLIFSVLFSLLTLISNSIILDKPIFHTDTMHNLLVFVSKPAFWNIIVFMGLLFSITLFHSGMTDYVGQTVLINYLFGKYHHPREEHRIFMFLDLKSSTAIAEKLGHDVYFKWLNEYYADLTDAIIETGGQIYQYVGDELVVTWTYQNGIRNNNCLQCFTRCREIIFSHREKYMTKYGYVPEFKAGLHGGLVTAGKIGVIKKEIVFTGDVLNTAARIQGLCNQYNASLLVSENLLEKMDVQSEFQPVPIGEITLRGKDETVRLYSLSAIRRDP